MQLLYHIVHKGNINFGVSQGNVKDQKLPSREKTALELLYQRLDHRSTISLLAGDTAYVWEDINLRIYPDPFFTSCQKIE